jgi:hypothetical protein
VRDDYAFGGEGLLVAFSLEHVLLETGLIYVETGDLKGGWL